MQNFKMTNIKDYVQSIKQMASYGAQFRKIRDMAFILSQTIRLFSLNLTRVARNSTRNRPSRSLRAHSM